jgi:hypothetical protein
MHAADLFNANKEHGLTGELLCRYVLAENPFGLTRDNSREEDQREILRVNHILKHKRARLVELEAKFGTGM